MARDLYEKRLGRQKGRGGMNEVLFDMGGTISLLGERREEISK
jgi:hypothetical protein